MEAGMIVYIVLMVICAGAIGIACKLVYDHEKREKEKRERGER